MWSIEIDNIGGIRFGEAQIKNGLNVVQASNFRGKSSFIAAIQTVLGTTGHYNTHPLTESDGMGTVKLKTSEETYDVVLEREKSGTVTRTGTPYLTDETDQICAKLFACLGEDNPIRSAVRNGEDLTELLQEPLDIENIDRKIAELKQQKERLNEEITEAERAGKELPSTQESVTQTEQRLSELREKRERLTKAENGKERVTKLSDELSSLTSTLENTNTAISRLEQQIDRKEQRLASKESELEGLEIPSEFGETFNAEQKQHEIERLETQVELIEDLRRANQNVLEQGDFDLITDIDRSISGDELVCWVCGQPARQEDIEAELDHLYSLVTELREQSQEIQSEFEEYEQHQQLVDRKRRKQEQLEEEVKQLRTAIDEHERELQTQRSRKDELETDISELREELKTTETEYNDELTDVKTEIRTLESKLSDEQRRLEDLERAHDELTSLRKQYEKAKERVTKLRGRKRRIQEDIKTQFNMAMSDIIDHFNPGFSGARLVLKTDQNENVEEIELEIVRDIDGSGRPTSVDTLSEGEVELIGVVVALAGYRAFDVDERSPIMLIDGISQLAAEHLRTLSDYLLETSDCLVTTAYPEAGEFEGHIIKPREWRIVSKGESKMA